MALLLQLDVPVADSPPASFRKVIFPVVLTFKLLKVLPAIFSDLSPVAVLEK